MASSSQWSQSSPPTKMTSTASSTVPTAPPQRYLVSYGTYNNFTTSPVLKSSEIKFPVTPIETPNVLRSVLPIPFNERYGNEICPKITKMLLDLFYDIIIINISEFMCVYGRIPDVSSSFMVSTHKNQQEIIEYNGKKVHVHIHNGSLVTIMDEEKNTDDLKDILNLDNSMTFLRYHSEYMKKMSM